MNLKLFEACLSSLLPFAFVIEVEKIIPQSPVMPNQTLSEKSPVWHVGVHSGCYLVGTCGVHSPCATLIWGL